MGPPLGAVEVGVFEEREVTLAPGVLMALYTDGLVERRGEVLDAGLERLRGALAGVPPTDADAARQRALEGCGADAADDDVTLVIVRAQERLGSPASYTLTPDPEALGALRRHLRRWLAETGADAEESADVVLSVNEAMQNAIEHGTAFGAAPITVRFEVQGTDVVIVVRDLGHDGERRPDPDRGRGLQLMESLMDGTRVDLGGPTGGAVTLRRQLVALQATALAAG